MLADLVSFEDLSLDSSMAVFSVCPHMAEGTRELSGVFTIRALILLMGTSPSELVHRLQVLPPDTITQGIKFQHMNLRRTKTFSLQQMVSSFDYRNYSHGENRTTTTKNMFMQYITLLGLLYLILWTGNLNDGNFFFLRLLEIRSSRARW